MTQLPVWPIFNNVIFDCDSTLSAVEGIDELARITGHDQDIASLTKQAMEGDVPLESVYGQRLKTASPTQDQVRRIANIYRENIVPCAKEVIDALQTLGIKVFIISGGLIQPVRDFGVWLGVPREQIFAVGMEYDQLAGKWWRYWEQPGGQNPGAQYMVYEAHPLAGTGGKNSTITAHVRNMHEGRTMLIGDGGSDLEASPEVDLFVGFGGAVFRKQIAEQSPVYIHKLSLASILPLALGQLGNTPPFTRLWAEGMQQFHNQEVVFTNNGLQKKFFGAMRR